jgi:hypothetical protein
MSVVCKNRIEARDRETDPNHVSVRITFWLRCAKQGRRNGERSPEGKNDYFRQKEFDNLVWLIP